MFQKIFRGGVRVVLLAAIIGAGSAVVSLSPQTQVLAAGCPSGQILDAHNNCVSPAASPSTQICQGVNGATGTADCGSAAGGTALPALVRNVINILLFVVGLIAVIMIIIGAIRYVTSNGEQASITSAKNTILYAVVGLVVAMLAYAIVNFVVGAFK